jgi:hypothetical protein
MASRSRIILTGSNLPIVRPPIEPTPSIINEKTVADFTRVLDEMGIEYRPPKPGEN